MKVLISYIQTGKYRDYAWEPPTLHIKGEIHAVTPSYAAQLIKKKQAKLVKTDKGDIIVDE